MIAVGECLAVRDYHAEGQQLRTDNIRFFEQTSGAELRPLLAEMVQRRIVHRNTSL
jgi:Lon protease-like protein